MEATRWEQIEHIFHEAIKLGGKERESYLAQVCADDPSLREETQSLIDSFEEDGTFLQKSLFERALEVLAEEPANISPGVRLSSYKIISRLGKGGEGVVYLAIDTTLGRKVALKVLSANLVEDENRVRRFRQEAQAASKISHPNVAAIYEMNCADEIHFIAMEFVDGITLRERLDQKPLPLKEAIDTAIQVGLAIESAHALGIVHRDIKPENVMIRRDGYVKVLDFGLAKLTETYQHPVNVTDQSIAAGGIPTEPGLLMGTPAYMSPEQARGVEVDGKTDIWSWGVLLYELTTGEVPFKGGTTSDLLADILRGVPALMAALPEPLKRILEKSLGKEKEDRYTSITDALKELREFQNSLPAHVDLHLPPSDKPLKPDSSTQSDEPQRTNQAGRADVTDFHVIADNYPTSKTRPARDVRFPASLWFWVNPRIVVPLVGIVIFISGLFAYQKLHNPATAVRQWEFNKLSSEENILEAIISPNGRYVASIIDESGLKSLWIRQINTSANLRIINPTKSNLGGLSFSPDGDSIYYLEYNEGHGTLFSVSALGGAPRRLIENVETPVTFSPDGGRIAFVRGASDNGTDLITAKSDGSEQSILAELTGTEKLVWDRIYATAPAWSPDGSTIACVAIDDAESSRTNVLSVKVTGGAVNRVNAQKGFLSRIRKLAWTTDSSGLIMIAKDQYSAPHQLWSLSYANGQSENLTNDADDYFGLSITADGHTLLTTRTTTLTHIGIMDRDSRYHQIASTNHNGTNGLSWTRDGRIIYGRNVGSSCDLWVMKPDGTDRKQLTFDGQWNLAPASSADGRYVVLVSYREGRPHVWRVRADGTDLKQLTNGTYEDTPILTHDGNWVIYRRRNPVGLWKVSIDGGEPEPVIKEASYFPDISPDGKYLAYLKQPDKPESSWQAAVVSFETGNIVNTFAIHSNFTPSVPGLRWTADGSSVSYVISENGVANVWSQNISGGTPAQVTNFTEGDIFYFSWSYDGQLATVRGASTKELLLISNFH
jgi:serine/threonine protein kinase